MNKLLLGLAILFLPITLAAQYQYQRINHLNVGKNAGLYNIDVDYHTSVRPLNLWQIDSLGLKPAHNDLKIGYKNWFLRKIFDENLVNLKGSNYELSINPVVNFRLGNDSEENFTPYINTRGFSIKGKLGTNFSFNSSFLENQARFSSYIVDFADLHNVVPGQGNPRDFKGSALDFSMASGQISYAPNNTFNFTLGQGRNFFGEGYRSMILSDVAYNYPYFKIETNFWKIKYVNLWAQMSDIRPTIIPADGVYPKKYLSLHYFSLNITKRWNVSLFESIILADTTQKRGIDPSFFNPVILYRPIEFANGSGIGNALLGVGSSYKIIDGLQVYGQMTLDEFTAKEFVGGKGYWANKYAYQLGVKQYDAFGVKGLFYRFEYNSATHYTYSHREPLSNYGHYGQPLAHPWGSNFKEGVAHFIFQHKRWEHEIRLHLGTIGLDTNNSNWGSDIYKSYNTREKDYDNVTTQGLKSMIGYALVRTSWLVNPASGLKIEAGIQIRKLNTSLTTEPLPSHNSQFIFVGLRTEFFNRYYDF